MTLLRWTALNRNLHRDAATIYTIHDDHDDTAYVRAPSVSVLTKTFCVTVTTCMHGSQSSHFIQSKDDDSKTLFIAQSASTHGS